MRQWESDKHQICADIKFRRAPLKIIIKTKNDIHFLRRWIDHHAKIVGIQNLIIMDNMSDDPEVIAIYDELFPDLLVFSFAGFHNAVHRPTKFPELYAAMRQSSEYFSFLDTDEFMYWANEDGSFLCDERLVEQVLALGDGKVVPGLWLENVPGYENRVTMFERGDSPMGMTSGKPIVSSALNLEVLQCHNFQLESWALRDVKIGNLIILHLKRFSALQRIRSNELKLRQYRILNSGQTAEAVLNMKLDELPAGNVQMWVGEIQRLWDTWEAEETPAGAKLKIGQIAFEPTGKIKFANNADRARYLHYLENARAYFLAAFRARGIID